MPDSPTPCQVSAIVLAGGLSRRMGQDKALLRIERQPLLVRVLERLSAVTDDLIVAAGDADRYAEVMRIAPPARCVADALPGAGPLGGILAGLSASLHPQAIVVACDMPFLNVSLLSWMVGRLPGYDAVVPRVVEGGNRRVQAPNTEGKPVRRAKDAGLHPLHAVYSTTCAVPIRSALERGQRSLGDLVAALCVRVVEADEVAAFDSHFLSLRNINTPEEYDAICRAGY